MQPEVVLKSIELIRAAKIAEVYRYEGRTIVVVICTFYSPRPSSDRQCKGRAKSAN